MKLKFPIERRPPRIAIMIGGCIPVGVGIIGIERRGARARLLTAIVFLGGLMRRLGVALAHRYAGPSLFGLGMELVATPLLCPWQARIARFEP